MGTSSDEVVYFNGSTAQTLQSRTKIAVMEELEKGERGFGELVQSVDRAKSTVSNHLADLEQMDLVTVEADAADRRKRVVRARSRRIASTGRSMELEDPLRNVVADSLDSREYFLKSIVVVLRYHAYTAGLNLNPGLREAGRLIGSELGESYDGPSRDEDAFLEWLSVRWGELGLGELETEYPSIYFESDFGCEKVPGPGVCGFYVGFLEGVLSTGLEQDVSVEMQSCEAHGTDRCRFDIV